MSFLCFWRKGSIEKKQLKCSTGKKKAEAIEASAFVRMLKKKLSQ